jgi:hypothetical protein
MPCRFVGKSFVELGIAGNSYVVICVFSIKKKREKNSDTLGLLNYFASSNFDGTHF